MKKFTPTPTQVRLAEALMASMAYEGTIRPIVEGYEQAILGKHQFRISRHWVDLGCEDEIILDRNKSYLLSEDDSRTYHAECFAARDAAGLKVDDPEFCPLLVAENLRITAENALLNAMGETPGLESLATGFMTTDLRNRAIDITLKLLAPSCGTSDDILKRIMEEKPQGKHLKQTGCHFGSSQPRSNDELPS